MSISPQDTMPPGPEDTPFHYPEYSHHGYYPPHAHPGHVQQNSPYFPPAAALLAAPDVIIIIIIIIPTLYYR